jgi:hypothetical protein
LSRTEEQLDIEGEAGTKLLDEEIVRSLSAEQLEAILRVPNRETGEQPHREAENLASELTVQRPALDDRAFDGAGSNRHVSPSANRIPQLSQLPKRRREVSIGNQHVFAASVSDAPGDRGALATMTRGAEHRPHCSYLCRSEDLTGAIVTAVIDNQRLGQFKAGVGGRGRCRPGQSLQQRREPRLLIVGGNNERKRRQARPQAPQIRSG